MRHGWIVVLALLCAAPAYGQCDPGTGIGGTGADVIVGELTGPNNYGNAGGFYAYSFGTTSCNIGTVPLLWISGGNMHPAIGQALFRVADGRFEQVGNSWLKQGFFALQGQTCENDAPPGQPDCNCSPNPNGSALGVGCSDPYGAGLNGSQSFGSLSARSEVQAPHRGFYIPVSLQPGISDLTTRRLRVAAADINPALNPGADYFAEGQYVTQDDSLAGNGYNSSSYREVNVSSNPNNFGMSFAGPTQRQMPAIMAWENYGAVLQGVFTGEAPRGRLIVGHNVVDNGNGTWTYNYAIYNQNSTRGVSSFEVQLPAGIALSGVGFTDTDYHSGDVIDNTDWTSTQTATSIRWEMTPAGGDMQFDNFVRWGSAYSFYFTASAGPTTVDADMDLYLTQDPANGTNFPAPNDRTISVLGPDGDFINPPTSLACNVSGFDVNLTWVNGEPYSSIDVTRDGVVIATLGGGATSYNDIGVGAGDFTYGVSGTTVLGNSGESTCDADVDVPAVSGLICNGSIESASLSWVNGASYTSIEVRREGNLIATLPGSATSYDDNPAPVGQIDYEVTGAIGGSDAADVLCTVDVLDQPPLGFTLTAGSATATYDELTGVGSFDTSITLLEDSANPGFPNSTSGFSIALSNDPTVLVPSSLTLGSLVAALNGGTGPEFSQEAIEPGGVSVGVIYDFQAIETLSVGSTTELASVSYDTNAAALAGDSVGVLTSLDFVNGVLGAAVDNIIVVGVDAIDPTFSDGAVDLQPVAGGVFQRGDCNSDGNTDIADAVTALGFLFPSGAPPTLACESACDGNNDGSINIADAVRILDALFGMPANPLPAPTGACGADPTPDTLTCDAYMGC